jgi:excisionase family DNA binding protein
MDNGKRLITATEASAQLGVARSTLYDLARRRKIPHIRLGDRLLFDLEEIIAVSRVPAEDEQCFENLNKSSTGAAR